MSRQDKRTDFDHIGHPRTDDQHNGDGVVDHHLSESVLGFVHEHLCEAGPRVVAHLQRLGHDDILSEGHCLRIEWPRLHEVVQIPLS